MRKRNRWTRLLAMILAVAMVLSSQSVTALATQVGIVVNNGTNETETPDETQTADETNSGTNPLPSPDQSAETTVNKPGVISGEGVNIRKGPGTDYEVVTKLQSGDAVTVLTQTTVTNGDGAEEIWYRIQYGTEGAEAYVLSEFVAVSETVEESEPESAEEPQVTAYSNGLSGETIQITCEPTFAAPGEVITLKAEGNVALEEGQKLRWQSASDGTTWKNITGAEEENTETYRFTYSDGNQGYSYRLAVVDEEGNVVAFSNSVSVKRMSPADLAATYYGEGATNPQTMAIVTMFRTDRADGTVYAGGTANFQINYQMNQSPMYKYGDQAKSLVDAYENSHITLTLPQGMTLDSPEKIVGATAKKISEEGAAQETWKFNLDDSMSTSANNSFGITVKINENGAASAGKEYLIGENDLKIYTEAPVLDKTDSDNPKVVATYPQTNTASSVPGTLRAGTQDEWGIQKTAGKLADNDRVYSEVNGDKITV